jgi:hypothetical protein
MPADLLWTVGDANPDAARERSHGWKPEVRRITHRDYPDKRDRQVGWKVIARRGTEVVTAT